MEQKWSSSVKLVLLVIVCVILPWLGFTVYNLLVLHLPFGASLLLPPVQIFWSVITIVGMVLYQRQARVVAVAIVTAVIGLLFVYRRSRRSSN